MLGLKLENGAQASVSWHNIYARIHRYQAERTNTLYLVYIVMF